MGAVNSTTVPVRPNTRLWIPLYITDEVCAFNVEIPFTLGVSMLAFAWIGVQDIVGLFLFSKFYGPLSEFQDCHLSH